MILATLAGAESGVVCPLQHSRIAVISVQSGMEPRSTQLPFSEGTGEFSVPYTYKSLAFMWLVILALFALTGSGVVTGRWLLALLMVALAAPALILRSPRPVGVTTTSHQRAKVVSDERDPSPLLDLGGIDVFRWENEGGAPPMHVRRGIREPAHS